MLAKQVVPAPNVCSDTMSGGPFVLVFRHKSVSASCRRCVHAGSSSSYPCQHVWMPCGHVYACAALIVLWRGAGDWMCGGCGQHNFRSRQECFKCASPKCGPPLPVLEC